MGCPCVIGKIVFHDEANREPIELHVDRNDVLNYVEARTREIFIDDHKKVWTVKCVEQYEFCHFCGKLIDWQRVHDQIAEYSDLVPARNTHERCKTCKELFEKRDLTATTKIVDSHQCNRCRCDGHVGEEDKKEMEAERIHRQYVALKRVLEEIFPNKNVLVLIEEIAPELSKKFGELL